ncbi:unnamed protein product, partial [Meganyctiphanes norvegica]
DLNWVILATDDSGKGMTKQDTKTIHIPTSRARKFRCYGIRVKDIAPRGDGIKHIACVAHIKFYIEAGVNFASAKGTPGASSHTWNNHPRNAFVHDQSDQKWCSKSIEDPSPILW